MTSLHSSLIEGNLHQPFHYVQNSDPGAVGAGKFWLDTTAEPFLIYQRNETDDGWYAVGGSGSGSSFSGAKVSRSTNQSISDATPTAISWSTNFYDIGADWVIGGSPTRLTNQFGDPMYAAIQGQIRWGASAAGSRTIRIVLNGTDVIAEKVLPDAQGDDDQDIYTTYILNTSDYVELFVEQDSGGALDIVQADFFSPVFSTTKLGDV